MLVSVFYMLKRNEPFDPPEAARYGTAQQSGCSLNRPATAPHKISPAARILRQPYPAAVWWFLRFSRMSETHPNI
jgi:hypothetical protein